MIAADEPSPARISLLIERARASVTRLLHACSTVTKRPERAQHIQLTGRSANDEFERLLAETITNVGGEGGAIHWRVVDVLNDAWFDHLYAPYYLLGDEYTWARFWVSRSEVKRKLAKLEGDFVVTSCVSPGEAHDAH